MRRILTAVVLSASFLLGGAVAVPAQAAPAMIAPIVAVPRAPSALYQVTYANEAALRRFQKYVGEEAGIAMWGCGLNRAVTDLIGTAKKSKAPNIQASAIVVAQVNKMGSGFCNTVLQLAKIIAYSQITWVQKLVAMFVKRE